MDSFFCENFEANYSALDLIALTETWLKSYIYNNELIPTNYAIYRNDRTSRGGGVMLAINNNISSSLVHSPTHLELLTVTLNYTKVITICLLYIPPNPDPKYISDLTEYLNSLRHTENLIILGDLNLPDVNWDSFSGMSFISSSLCEEFFNLNFCQLVTEPTHNRGNLLDVILTNASELIDKVCVSSTLPLDLSSDHYIVKFCINTCSTSKTVAQQKFSNSFNFAKADWNGMLNFLTSYNFTSYFEMCDIESLWSYLKLIIFEAIHLFTPRVSSRSHEKPKWFTSDLRHTLNCVHSLRRKQSKKPSANLQIKLADAELSLQKDMIAAKAAFESSLIHNFATTNSNKIFKYISSVNKSCTLPTTMCLKILVNPLTRVLLNYSTIISFQYIQIIVLRIFLLTPCLITTMATLMMFILHHMIFLIYSPHLTLTKLWELIILVQKFLDIVLLHYTFQFIIYFLNVFSKVAFLVNGKFIV